MSQGQTCCSDLHVVRSDDHSSALQIGPETGVTSRLGKVKRFQQEAPENRFHMLFSACPARGIFGAFHAVKQLGGCDR